jgi:hypothetical protein
MWKHSSGLRLRPVPELGICLAYRPKPPALHGLNLTSWLVLQLCDGRNDAALAEAYRDCVQPAGGAGDAAGALDLALHQLKDLGLIERR